MGVLGDQDSVYYQIIFGSPDLLTERASTCVWIPPAFSLPEAHGRTWLCRNSLVDLPLIPPTCLDWEAVSQLKSKFLGKNFIVPAGVRYPPHEHGRNGASRVSGGKMRVLWVREMLLLFLQNYVREDLIFLVCRLVLSISSITFFLWCWEEQVEPFPLWDTLSLIIHFFSY